MVQQYVLQNIIYFAEWPCGIDVQIYTKIWQVQSPHIKFYETYYIPFSPEEKQFYYLSRRWINVSIDVDFSKYDIMPFYERIYFLCECDFWFSILETNFWVALTVTQVFLTDSQVVQALIEHGWISQIGSHIANWNYGYLNCWWFLLHYAHFMVCSIGLVFIKLKYPHTPMMDKQLWTSFNI